MATTKQQLADERDLEDLISVGPATRRDFEMLGIHTVADLATQDPQVLYNKLCRKTRTRQDPCVLDVFHAAIAQARNPKLPADQCQWWYWSKIRKAEGLTKTRSKQRRSVP